MPPERLLRPATLHSASASPPIINGYAALAKWAVVAGHTLRSYKANWHVPDSPSTDSGQTIYLFIGAESTAGVGDQTILQPVLQWGVDGLKRWAVASYCVCGSPGNLKFAAKTKSVPVSEGERLTASIILQSSTDGAFNYLSEFEGIAETKLYIGLPQAFTQIGLALEAYEVMKLSDLPSSGMTRFDQLRISLDGDLKPEPDWQIANPELQYGIQAVPVTHEGIQSEIDVLYRAT